MSTASGAAHGAAPFLLWLELGGVLLGAWGTWLTAAASLWNWPVSIAGSLLFAGLFCRTHLYGAAAMQVFYVALGLLGWRWWLRGGRDGGAPPLSRITPPAAGVLSLLTLAAAPGVALCLQRAHDAAPVGDALALVLSLAGQYLVAKKLVEHWYLWMAADAVYVVLSLSQRLPLIGGLYVLHLFGCGYGLWRWRRALVPGGVQSSHP